MDLLHSCEITCNIWILQTKNKKAYLDAAKFKTNEDCTWEDFQSSLQFQNVPKMCGLSINSICICSRKSQNFLKKKKKKLNISLFNHTYIFYAHDNYFI